MHFLFSRTQAIYIAYYAKKIQKHVNKTQLSLDFPYELDQKYCYTVKNDFTLFFLLSHDSFGHAEKKIQNGMVTVTYMSGGIE